MAPLPRVITDDVLSDDLAELLEGKVERLPWATLEERGETEESVEGVLTFGHGPVTAEHMSRGRIMLRKCPDILSCLFMLWKNLTVNPFVQEVNYKS